MKPDICVFAGRFRPFHAGHYHVVKAALDAGEYVFVIVGSINEPINFRNPFTFAEVREMIRASLTPEEADRVFILGIEDYDTDIKWVAAVRRLSPSRRQLHLGDNPAISLIGYSKDASSYYLKLFPQWGSIEVKDGNPNLDATAIRGDLYYGARSRRSSSITMHEDGKFFRTAPTGSSASGSTRRVRATPREYFFMQEYLAQFPQTPYPRFFTAADACVIQSGHVLLVRRGQMPGEGLWALPGGHVGMHETFKEAAIRELIEETGIDIPGRSQTCSGCCDPWRKASRQSVALDADADDLVAYGIYLEGTSLPAVEGRTTPTALAGGRSTR
jgi:bifunctional NMN adenylyltransferase/nudix hydrolase